MHPHSRTAWQHAASCCNTRLEAQASSFWNAGTAFEAFIANDGDSLYFNQHTGYRKVGHRDLCTGGKVAIRKHFRPHFCKGCTVACVRHEGRHGHDVFEAATSPFQSLVQQRENSSCLCLKVALDVLASCIRGRGFTCKPDCTPAFGDDGR